MVILKNIYFIGPLFHQTLAADKRLLLRECNSPSLQAMYQEIVRQRKEIDCNIENPRFDTTSGAISFQFARLRQNRKIFWNVGLHDSGRGGAAGTFAV